MYNTKFIFNECGFDWLPDYLNKDNLFNVSYDINTEVIKLYILDESKSFLYKVSTQGITKQYDAIKFKADPSRLSEFLGIQLDYEKILIDTVESDVYYLYLEETPASDYISFIDAVCRKYGIKKSRFIEVVNRINKRQIENIYESFLIKAVSGIKVPFLTTECKIYSRPFKLGNSYDLGEKATQFLTRLYHCDETSLKEYIRYLWVSSELFSDRVVLTTQYHELVHQPDLYELKPADDKAHHSVAPVIPPDEDDSLVSRVKKLAVWITGKNNNGFVRVALSERGA